MGKSRIAPLLLSSASGQLLGLGCSFLVPLLYTPDHVGVYGVFLSINRLFSAVVTGNLEGVFYTTQSEERKKALLVLPLAFAILVTIALSILILVGMPLWVDLLQLETHGQVLYFVPVLVFLQGLIQTAQNYYNALQWDNKVHGVQFFSPVLAGIGKISLPIWGAFGLVWGHVAGLGIAVLSTTRTMLGNAVQFGKWSSWRMEMKNFQKWWSWGTLSGLVNLLGLEALFLGTQHVEGAVFTGLLTIGFRYVRFPVELMNGALTKTWLSDVAQESLILRDVVFSQLKRQMVFLIPFLTGVAFFAIPFVTFVWGESWKPAGEIAVLFIPFLGIHAMGSMIAPLADLLHKLRTEFIFMSILTLGRLYIMFWMEVEWETQMEYFVYFSTLVWVVYLGVMIRWLKPGKEMKDYGI